MRASTHPIHTHEMASFSRREEIVVVKDEPETGVADVPDQGTRRRIKEWSKGIGQLAIPNHPISEHKMNRKIREQTAYIDMLESDQVYNATDKQDWRRSKAEMQDRISILEEQLEAAVQMPEILRQSKQTAETLARILAPSPSHDNKRQRKD